MRALSRLLAVSTVVAVPALASAGAGPRSDRLDAWVHRLPVALGVSQAGPAPRAIPTGGPLVDIAHLVNPQALERDLRQLMTAEGQLRLTIPDGQAHWGPFAIGSHEHLSGNVLVLHGDAVVYGQLDGNLVTLDGDIVLEPGGSVGGEALALGGKVRELGGRVGGEIRAMSRAAVPLEEEPGALALFGVHAAGLLGVFLTLTAIGFGLVLFGRPNLEIVSDTVTHSFGRAFVVGLLGQILLLPTFGMIVVGLVLTVVGVLLVPFAVIVYGLLVIIGVVGGFLAVAHAMGETHTRRRLAQGRLVESPNSYRYMLVGLASLLSIWLAWVVFGWVPVAGSLIWSAGALVTWLLATVGFGACLLSRAGIRPNFAGRLIPPEAMTDEYLWATPQMGVPAVKRPTQGTRTPPES